MSTFQVVQLTAVLTILLLAIVAALITVGILAVREYKRSQAQKAQAAASAGFGAGLFGGMYGFGGIILAFTMLNDFFNNLAYQKQTANEANDLANALGDKSQETDKVIDELKTKVAELEQKLNDKKDNKDV